MKKFLDCNNSGCIRYGHNFWFYGMVCGYGFRYGFRSRQVKLCQSFFSDRALKHQCCVRYVDEERECLSNRAGNGYNGSVNVSASGKPCVPWTEVPPELYYDLPVNSTIEASNYCRYIPDQQWLGTSCGVRTKTGVQLERCNVPYCGGNILI